MERVYVFTTAAKAAAFIAAFVLFAPVALATLMQAAQIIA